MFATHTFLDAIMFVIDQSNTVPFSVRSRLEQGDWWTNSI